jgi:hypothetical protein
MLNKLLAEKHGPVRITGLALLGIGMALCLADVVVLLLANRQEEAVPFASVPLSIGAFGFGAAGMVLANWGNPVKLYRYTALLMAAAMLTAVADALKRLPHAPSLGVLNMMVAVSSGFTAVAIYLGAREVLALSRRGGRP